MDKLLVSTLPTVYQNHIPLARGGAYLFLRRRLAQKLNLNIAVGFHLLAAKNAKIAKRPLYFNQMLFIELAGT